MRIKEARGYEQGSCREVIVLRLSTAGAGVRAFHGLFARGIGSIACNRREQVVKSIRRATLNEIRLAPNILQAACVMHAARGMSPDGGPEITPVRGRR